MFNRSLSLREHRYGYEQNILTTANSLIEKDMYRRVKALHKGLARAFAPRNHRCMSCGASLQSVPMSTTQRRGRSRGARTLMCVAFGCGHSFHEPCVGDTDDQCPLCAQERRKAGRTRYVCGCAWVYVCVCVCVVVVVVV